MRSMSDRINEGDVDDYNITTNKPNLIIRFLSYPARIRTFILSKFKRATPVRKTYADVSLEQIQKKPVLQFYDKVTLAIGAVLGMLGVVLIYNQLPTHPLIVIGISCVCVGVSTIVSISRW